MSAENSTSTDANRDTQDAGSIITVELIDVTIDDMWNGRGSPAYMYGKTLERIIPADDMIVESDEY